jgi:3-oxoadipate enol-lactonase
VRGADLMVEVIGSYGPAFVWSHGILSSRDHEDRDALFNWRQVVAHHWRWVRYDSRGHGESSGTTNVAAYSWGELGRDLMALADALGIARFAGGGASTGCAAVIEAALAAPQRIDRLVLVTPPAAWDDRPAQVQRYESYLAQLRSQGSDTGKALIAGLARPPILADEPTLPPFVPGVPDEWVPAVLRGTAVSDLPPPARVSGLTQPALILAWDTDPAHPLSTAYQLAECLPRAELYVAHTARQVTTWPPLVAGFLGWGA